MQRINSDRRPGDQGGVTATTPELSAGPARAIAEAARRVAGWRRWLPWGGGLLLAGAGLFTLYLRQSRIAPFNSDGAAIVLQAQAMLHGNLLLHGWWLADVTFYTTELPEYMLIQLFHGLGPDVVHIGGALTYTLTVLLGALLARGRAKGRAGLARALLAVGILLAPGIIGGTVVFLENPDHAGTAVPILLALLLLDRAPERWYVPVAVCALLTLTQMADQLTMVAAIGPVAAVAVLRIFTLAARQRPLPEFRFDGLLLAAAGVSFEAAKYANAALRHLGGFVTGPLPKQLLAPSSQIPANTRVMGQTIMLLFGANYPGRNHQQIEIIARFHLIGLVLAAAGLAVAIATFFGQRMDRVSQILVVGLLATVAAGILGTELPALDHAHEVAILLPFGAVLAGRVLPGMVPERWRPGRVLPPLLAAWLAGGLAALCFAATWAPMPSPYQGLADWLAGHRYTEGLAGYWQADSTTVTSGGKVLVAQVSGRADTVRLWETSASWYDPHRQRANFVVAVPAADGAGLDPAVVFAAFGRPASEHLVGPFVVMVYDYNLLSKVSGAGFPG